MTDVPQDTAAWLWTALRWVTGILGGLLTVLGGWLVWELRGQRERTAAIERSVATLASGVEKRGEQIESLRRSVTEHAESDERAHTGINERLNRMEDKIDRLLERGQA